MAKTHAKATSSSKKCGKYLKKTLDRAIAAAKRGTSKKEASMKYSVPRSTLIFQCKLNHPIDRTDRRPDPDIIILTQEEERVLQELIVTFCQNVFSRPKLDIILNVKGFLELNIRDNPFINK